MLDKYFIDAFFEISRISSQPSPPPVLYSKRIVLCIYCKAGSQDVSLTVCSKLARKLAAKNDSTFSFESFCRISKTDGGKIAGQEEVFEKQILEAL